MIRPIRRLALLGAIAALTLIPATARCGTIVPLAQNITNNGNADLSGQLFVEITDLGGGVIRFLANNAAGGTSSAIQAFTIQLGSIPWTSAVLIEGPGTDFQFDLTYNLPGGNSLSPPFNETFAITRTGGAANGINPGEYAGFKLETSASLGDIRAAIADGTIRLGVHVQSIGTTEGSDSYVNGVIPEPSALVSATIGAGFLGLAALRRRRLA